MAYLYSIENATYYNIKMANAHEVAARFYAYAAGADRWRELQLR
jgi:hypothetical protein